MDGCEAAAPSVLQCYPRGCAAPTLRRSANPTAPSARRASVAGSGTAPTGPPPSVIQADRYLLNKAAFKNRRSLGIRTTKLVPHGM